MLSVIILPIMCCQIVVIHRSCDAGTERLISRVKKARKFAKVRQLVLVDKLLMSKVRMC